jgi:hypothetical protein
MENYIYDKTLCKFQKYYLSPLFNILQIEENIDKTICYYLNHFPL